MARPSQTAHLMLAVLAENGGQMTRSDLGLDKRLNHVTVASYNSLERNGYVKVNRQYWDDEDCQFLTLPVYKHVLTLTEEGRKALTTGPAKKTPRLTDKAAYILTRMIESGAELTWGFTRQGNPIWKLNGFVAGKPGCQWLRAHGLIVKVSGDFRYLPSPDAPELLARYRAAQQRAHARHLAATR